MSIFHTLYHASFSFMLHGPARTTEKCCHSTFIRFHWWNKETEPSIKFGRRQLKHYERRNSSPTFKYLNQFSSLLAQIMISFQGVPKDYLHSIMKNLG